MRIHNPAKFISTFLLVIAAAMLFALTWHYGDPLTKDGSIAAVLTEYSDATGAQAMFYTLRTREGLVVIDGGAAANSEYVRAVIKDLGDHVNCWIITHGHPDHVGAFNVIYNDPQSMTIDSVITTDFDLDKYHELCNWWDEPEYYDTFMSLVKDEEGEYKSSVVTTRAGDELLVCGLKIDVFSSYTDVKEDYGDDIANLGSLIFKVTAGNSSILFTSDVHNNRDIYGDLVVKYGKKLQADYLQMGHHGNNSCPKEFVEVVKPYEAFMDCPEGFFESGDYDSAANREMLQDLGIEVHSYGTAPNEIYMR